MRKSIKIRTLRIVTFVVALLLLLNLLGCSKLPGSTPNAEATNTPNVISTAEMTSTEIQLPTESVTETIEPTVNAEPSNKTVYRFEVDLDYNKHSLLVRQTIQYQNQTGQVLTEIKLVVPPNAKSKVFSLNSLEVFGDATLKDYSLDGVMLTLQLAQPLSAIGSISISLNYNLNPKMQGGVLGYSAKQLNLSDWYPFVPPYDLQNGWIIHQPAEVGEYLVYEGADFDLTLNLIDPTGLIVAASVDAAPLDLDTYHILAENRRGITLSISDQYTLVTNTIDGITVKGYVFVGDEVAGQAAVDYTASALQLYSELFGLPYPHQTLSVVESDFPDGMEYDGLYYLSDFYYKNYDSTFQNYLALLSVHETSHQWWFAAVANDQALEPWLDESLATYSEYLYIERYYPELTNWWWDYRVNYYKPAGRVNLTIYDQTELRAYINAVYLQGAVFLDKLRQALGDEVFFAGLKIYTNTYNQQIASWEEFLEVMEPDPSDAIKTLLQENIK